MRGGWGGGHDDVQAASRTPHTTSKTNPSLFLMSKMLRSRFWECLNLLGSTCVFHGICSVFVLSDHLWFGSSFPVEFATPVAVAVLGLELLQLHRP